jgi:hypothetical protein
MTDMVINQAATDHRSTEDQGQEGCSGIGRAGLSCIAESGQVVEAQTKSQLCRLKHLTLKVL